MENDAAKKPTSKQRVSRIPLNYHQRSDGIRRSRNRLTAVAAVLSIGLVAAMAASRELHNAGVSPGPVARAHMAFEHDCSWCHETFTPIHEDARETGKSIRGFIRVADSADSITHKCQACHRAATHHPYQDSLKAGSCTACHHEHRGEEAALTDADVRSCTRCHGEMKEEYLESKSLFADSKSLFADIPDDAKTITSFPYSDKHPEFRSQASDPTRLKFNHKLHLAKGIRNDDERRPEWTLADIAPDQRNKYRRLQEKDAPEHQSDEQTVVNLDCHDCHVTFADKSAGLGAGADVSEVDFKNLPRNQPPIGTGAYMLPVKYAEHCQGCHPLAIERPGDGRVHANEVPHGVQGEDLHRLLAGRFFEKQVEGTPGNSLTRDAPSSGNETSQSRIRPLPGENPAALPREVETTIESRVRKVETHLRDVACGKCHDTAATPDPNGLISIEPVNMPVVWLQKSHFNHRAHRSVFNRPDTDRLDTDRPDTKGCLECHDAKTSTETSQVLIKGIQKCRECHAPPDVRQQLASPPSGFRQQTGADYRCKECHRYHRGDLEALGLPAVHAHHRAQQPAVPLQEGNRASEE